MANKEYPVAGAGIVYVGMVYKTGGRSYMLSVGTEGSEVPLLPGEFLETGPFTTLAGIKEWLVYTHKALIASGAEDVSFHANNAAIFHSALEQIVGEGVTLDLSAAQKSISARGLPKKN